MTLVVVSNMDLLYHLCAGRFPKCMARFTRIICARGGSKSGPWECNLVFALFMYALSACQRYVRSFSRVRKRASKSGPWACNFVLVSFVCIACARGGSKSGPWECNLVFALIMHYQRVDAMFGASTALERELPKVDLGNATLSSYSLSAGRFQNTNFDNGRVATRT